MSAVNDPALPDPQSADPSGADSAALREAFLRVRQRTLSLAAPLSAEDAMVQSMPDASPAKWHLGHTTWFFERFVLGRDSGYRPIEPDWHFIFNSYYETVGPMHARPMRGLLSRPSLQEVVDYRQTVDERVARLLSGGVDPEVLEHLTLGLHHEQQHQELLLTDIKHALWCNPLRPAYQPELQAVVGEARPLEWHRVDEQLVEVGAPPWPAATAFAFDSESPRHRVLLQPHALASRPVTNAEYRAFIDDGGYRTVDLWLSDGWARINAEGWTRPFYWDEDLEREFTLGGVRPIDPAAPVSHLSYIEADAFARWAGARLPTEFEWEHAAASLPVRGNFADRGLLHPAAAQGPVDAGVPMQMFGDVWEWTSSAYAAYPGFRPLPGSLGEYNGKFMSGQQVLRGGSCASPADHLRASYRNFFHPPDRWQFSGLRLARDIR